MCANAMKWTLVATVIGNAAVGSNAFQINSFQSRGQRQVASDNHHRNVRSFATPMDVGDLDSVMLSAGHAADFLHQQLQQYGNDITASSPHLLVADAAAPPAAPSAGPEWWQNYISIYKNSLRFVHSQIDGPLRSVGWDQTWGVSIFLFTFAVRSCLVPVSFQQSKSAEYIKALKPYQAEIRKKFSDRKELMNQALGKLYEDAGTNPLSGCLFSLLQLPVFLGLYRSVTGLAKEGELRESFLWIPNLAGPVSPPTYRGIDWLTTGWHTPDGGGFPVPQLGWETTLAFLIMPVLLVLGQSFTMSVLTPPVDDDLSEEEKKSMENSQRIIKFLPLMIGYFSLQVPAGLTIYWLTSNGFTLLQSLTVRAYYSANPPKVELPEYWDALEDVESMTPEERRAAAEAGLSTGPKFEDLLAEARCHFVVTREPLRESSPAWERVASNGKSIPSEMAAWVKEDEGKRTAATTETFARVE